MTQTQLQFFTLIGHFSDGETMIYEKAIGDYANVRQIAQDCFGGEYQSFHLSQVVYVNLATGTATDMSKEVAQEIVSLYQEKHDFEDSERDWVKEMTDLVGFNYESEQSDALDDGGCSTASHQKSESLGRLFL